VRLMAEAPVGRESSSLRLAVWVAIVIVGLTDFGYLLIIRIQESQQPDAFTTPFVAVYLALMAALLGISLLDRPLAVRLRPAFRAAAAAGLLVIGVLALMSIGVLLVVAAVIVGVTAAMSTSHFRLPVLVSQVAAAILAGAVVIAGFEVTERLIICPAQGTMGGSGPGFVTGGYHYECVNGRLYMHSGFCSSSGESVDAQGNVTVTNNC
jgi:hypothetical protein